MDSQMRVDVEGHDIILVVPGLEMTMDPTNASRLARLLLEGVARATGRNN